MTRTDDAYEIKRDLVARLKEQVAILGEIAPPRLRAMLSRTIDLKRYDDLLAQGPSAKWPTGFLSGPS
jgi:hypothetical protein